MTCLRIPTSLADADAVIASCSGHVDWRPLFILGVQTAMLLAVATIVALVTVHHVVSRGTR
jgi:hypothetical protein